MESTNVYDLRDFTEVSARLEKNDGSNTGKGFATYFKDGEMYEMEVIYVDGRKEGKGILRDKTGKIVGNYLFRDDKLCVFDAVGKAAKNGLSNPQKPSKLRFSPVKSDASLWNRIKLFLIIFVVSYVVYEGFYFIYISSYINVKKSVTISNCETVRHFVSKSNIYVGRLAYYLNSVCKSSQDDPFLLQKFKDCYELSLFRGNQFTELKFEKKSRLSSLSISDYHSVKNIYISGLYHLEDLHIYPYSLSSAKTMELRGLDSLEYFTIDEGALPSLEHLSLNVQSEAYSIRIRQNSLQSLTILDFQFQYDPTSILIGQGALPSLRTLPTDFFKFKEITIEKNALQSIEEINISGGSVKTITIYSEMNSMTIFNMNSCNFIKTISIGDGTLQHVKTFSLRNLAVLTNLNIYDNSLNSAEVFELINIPKLEKLVIPNNCLNSVKTFTIRQLYYLRMIVIRKSSLQSLPELVLEGNELPYLNSFECKEYSFSSVSYLGITNLTNLNTLVFRENSFTESFEQEPTMKHRKTASITNCLSLQSIILEDFVMSEFAVFNIHTLPKLETLKTGGFSFFNIDRFIIRGKQNHYSYLIKLII